MRENLLNAHQFNPSKDLTYSKDGLIEFNQTKTKLLKDIESYFLQRQDENETPKE